MNFRSFLIWFNILIFFSSRLIIFSCFQLLLNAVVTEVSLLSSASSTFFGAFGGSQSDFEYSFLMYCSSSFLLPNFTKHKRTALFSLLKSIGIFVVSGFIDIPNPKFNPKFNPSVSNISFDTDSFLLHKLWHFRLFGFRGRSVGLVVVLIRWTVFCLTECLASAMIPNFLWQIS